MRIPRILLQWSEYKAQGNLTELKRLRTEIVNQLKWHEELIKSTNGAILQPQEGLKTVDHYVTGVSRSPDQYNPDYSPPYNKIAYVANFEYLGGTVADGYYTRLVAKNYHNAVWGEALTHCHTNDGYMTSGEIYAYAKAGPDTGTAWGPFPGEWCNYLIAQVAFDPDDMWDWHFLGAVQVFSSTCQWYDFGSTYWLAPYNYRP